MTGTGVVAAFTMEGEPVWRRDLQAEFGEFGLMWGYASSPALHGGRLIVEVLHGMRTDAPSYVAAFDGATGELAWRVERPTDAPAESPDAYTTPAVLSTGAGEQIVVSGGDYLTGHDPASGRELWRVGGLNPGREGNYRIVGSPIAVGGMVYAQSRKKPLLAFRVGEEGRVGQDDLAWRWEGAGAPDVPTAACDGTHFYMVDDRGLATALDARTGRVVWGPERTAQGRVSASPVVADGKLYVLNEDGVTTVLAAGAEYGHLATNPLDGSFTLVLAGGGGLAAVHPHRRAPVLHRRVRRGLRRLVTLVRPAPAPIFEGSASRRASRRPPAAALLFSPSRRLRRAAERTP